jgi:Ras GTPase-activating protein 3
MMDETMRLAGLHYLHETLRPSLETVISEHKSCEIDPTRTSDSDIEANQSNLKVVT